MIQKFLQPVNRNMGNTSLLRAHGLGETNATFTSFPLLQSAEGGQRGREATALFCISRKAKRKNFRSLIEKIFPGARIKKYIENFSFLLLRRQAEWRRSRAGLSPVGRQSEISVGILFKIGSNFIQKVPPIYDFRVFESSCLAFASLGLGKSNDFIRIFEIKKQFSLQNLEVRFAEGEHKLKNLLTNLFCSTKGGTQSGNLSREAELTAQKRL